MSILNRAMMVSTGCALVCISGCLLAGQGWAQEASARDRAAARTERIKALQAQAARIQKELEAMRRVEVKEKPAAARQGPPTAKPLDGVTRSAAAREEFTEQPTRHMRESLESLPGTTVRQGDGPRDFNISIRGSGANAGSR
ncbi:MAG: Plug domain-containing protein [Nitrospirota bacterium]